MFPRFTVTRRHQGGGSRRCSLGPPQFPSDLVVGVRFRLPASPRPKGSSELGLQGHVAHPGGTRGKQLRAFVGSREADSLARTRVLRPTWAKVGQKFGGPP